MDLTPTLGQALVIKHFGQGQGVVDCLKIFLTCSLITIHNAKFGCCFSCCVHACLSQIFGTLGSYRSINLRRVADHLETRSAPHVTILNLVALAQTVWA